MIEIYTDGACKGNPGPGGWAAVIIDDGAERHLHGRQEHTTNNQMEILAVIKGLESVEVAADITVFSDSQYVVNTMTRNWKRIANKKLWDRLDAEVNKHRVTWQWVRGHAGNPLNEKADVLASQEAGADNRGAGASLSHLDESGKARMVDVGQKSTTKRVAVARGAVVMMMETIALIRSNNSKKGDVLGVARVAGIMGAKATSHLIPLCHPISLDQVAVEFELDSAESTINITATVKTTAKTGVEMEAMTAVSVAALTIYDMCKKVDRTMRIEKVRVVRKSGGKSGDIVLDQ